jgi:hypothetical protein
MNLVVIVLAFIIIFLIYVLYFYFTSTVVTLSGLTYYGNGPATLVVAKNVINPTSLTYSYGIWLYITEASHASAYTATNGQIFTRANELKLWFDGLNLNLNCLNSTPTPATDNTIYPNIPVQKWVQVIISVGTTNVDVYINGGLNYTIPYINGTTIPSAASDINFNIGILPMYISNFQRWSTAITPEIAHSSYMNGNGMSNSLMPSLNVSASILHGGVVQSQYTMF